MRGRKPKPTKLKLMTGNPGKRALPKHEPAPERALAERPPARLSKSARKLWKELRPELVELGAGSPDAAAFEQLCEVGARILQCRKVIESEGLTYERSTETGTIVAKRPEVGILEAAEREFRALLEQFGLTTGSRCRIDLDKLGKGPIDSLAAFARKRG